MKIIKGKVSAQGVRVAIVGSCFNAPIADLLVSGAKDVFLELGGRDENLIIVRVPGAFEIPYTIKKLSSCCKLDAVVACGVLIQGETTHYDLIASQTAHSIHQLTLELSLPIIFSIITAPSAELAWERAGIKGPNLGASGMRTALEMASLFGHLDALRS